NDSGAARDCQGRREPGGGPGLLAVEQGTSSAGAVQGARHRFARASRGGRHRQAGYQGEDARAEEAARRRARQPRRRHAQERPPPPASSQPSDSRARRITRVASTARTVTQGGTAMAEVSTITAGAFCWPELSTTDQKAAVAFYRNLFGWGLEDAPVGPGETYSMFSIRGKHVSAAYTMRPEEKAMGAPPHWNSYVAVVNVDESTKKAKTLGAKVFAEPFDVMDAGRMSVLQDPAGAVVSLWQAKKHTGAQVVGATGTL